MKFFLQPKTDPETIMRFEIIKAVSNYEWQAERTTRQTPLLAEHREC